MLEQRADELGPWIDGYHDSETDQVAVAVSEMYSAFPSMGSKSNHEAAAKMSTVMRALADYPAWAILKACARIGTKGFVRMEGDKYVTERHWPPSDPELIEEVRKETKFYSDQYERIADMLTAEVE